MNARSRWSRILVIVGGLAMLVGAVDPLEGSVIILAGTGLVTLGTFFGQLGRRMLVYWIAVLILVAVGVGAMFVLSAFGGIGGSSGHSMWWGLVVLPYPVGWLMGIAGLVFRLARRVRHRHAAA